MEFVEDLFPLIIHVAPSGGMEERHVHEMAAYYDALWARDQRFSLLTYTPGQGAGTGARVRKLIAEWANSPRARRMSAKYCVGSSTVVPSALARGALTAILWLWTPAAPHEAFGTVEEAVDYCLEKLVRAEVPMPYGRAEMRTRALAIIRRAPPGKA